MPQLEGGQLPFSDNKLHAVRLMLTYLGAEGLAYALPGDSPPAILTEGRVGLNVSGALCGNCFQAWLLL